MLEAFGLSDPGCVRANNEDYYLLAPAFELYIVADGMGGAQAGEHASKLAVETVAEFVAKSSAINGEILLQSIEEANRRVLSEAAGDPALHGMGTTLTVACKVADELLLANVGDSRAYMFVDQELHVITEDQTWVNEVGRRLGIGEEALKNHPMRHVLTMAIGVSDALRIHPYAVPLRPGAQFLLCSDGLHGVVSQQTIVETLSSDSTLENKCQVLIQAAKSAGGPDNITAVLLTYRDSRFQLPLTLLACGLLLPFPVRCTGIAEHSSAGRRGICTRSRCPVQGQRCGAGYRRDRPSCGWRHRQFPNAGRGPGCSISSLHEDGDRDYDPRWPRRRVRIGVQPERWPISNSGDRY